MPPRNWLAAHGHTWLATRPMSTTAANVIRLALVLATLLASRPGAAADPSLKPTIDFSGSNRTRYERLAPQYRAGFGGSDTVLAIQTNLVLEAGWPRLSFVGEIADARGELNDEDSFTSGVVNTLEPLQTYVSWRFAGVPESAGQSSLRVGRMTMDLGKRRLLARSNFRHAVASFTGADWEWRGANGMRARAFYVVPMRILPSNRDEMLDNDVELDRGARDASLLGMYYLSAPLADRTQIELTLLDLDAPNGAGELLGPLDMQTYALRVFRPVGRNGWNYEIEGGTQRGVSALTAGTALDHDAYYAHAEIGYAFDVPWTPNLLLQYDRASGDADPADVRNDRFNPLFGERRFDFGPTSIYGIFQRSNIESVGIRLVSTPAPRWRHMVAYRDYRLASAHDAWVGSGRRDPAGLAGKSLGQQIETSFTLTAIPNRLSIETGFALTDLGRFPQQTAGDAFLGSARYFYAAVTTTF
jgi:hypothetical protein